MYILGWLACVLETGDVSAPRLCMGNSGLKTTAPIEPEAPALKMHIIHLIIPYTGEPTGFTLINRFINRKILPKFF